MKWLSPTALVALALLAGLLAWGLAEAWPVHTAAGVTFLNAAKVKGESFTPKVSKDAPSPVAQAAVAGTAWLLSLSPLDASRLVSSLSLGLLALLLALAASRLMPLGYAVLGVLLFLLHPSTAAAMNTDLPATTVLLLLAGPACLLVLALAANGRKRLLLCAAAGMAAGLAAVGHHLGAWVALALLLALFAAVPGARRKQGQITLPPLGLELLVTLVAAAATALLIGRLLLDMTGKSTLDFVFGPFMTNHPPCSVAGTAYREAADGHSPPLWNTLRLLLVRMPPALLLGSAVAACFGFINRFHAPLRLLWLPAAAAGTVLLVASLCGSPAYAHGLDLLPVLMIVPCLLSAFALADLVRTAREWTRPRRTAALAAAAALALLAPLHEAMETARLLPWPAAYANILGRGTAGFLEAGNELFMQPSLDKDAAQALLSSGTKKAAIIPWGKKAQPVLDRFAGELKMRRVKAVDGGPVPTLMVYAPASATWRGMEEQLSNETPDLSLELAGFPVWMLFPAEAVR